MSAGAFSGSSSPTAGPSVQTMYTLYSDYALFHAWCEGVGDFVDWDTFSINIAFFRPLSFQPADHRASATCRG